MGAMTFNECIIRKYNKNHDKSGRFTTAGAAVTISPDKRMCAKAASAAVAKAKEAEPAITGALQEVAAATGGQMIGLEFRTKTEESLARKLEKEGREKKLDIKASLDRMYDINRYTTQYSEENMTAGIQQTFSTLESKGYTVMRVKNTFPDESAGYRGINAVVKTPQGTNFELQFHTAKSFEVKMSNHTLYEKQRAKGVTKEQYDKYEAEMAAAARSIPMPKGISSIKTFNNLE